MSNINGCALIVLLCILCQSMTNAQPLINSKSFLQEDKLYVIKSSGEDNVLNLKRFGLANEDLREVPAENLYPPPPSRPPNTFQAYGGWALSEKFFVFDLKLPVRGTNYKVRLLNYFDLPSLDTLTLAGKPPTLTACISKNYYTLGHDFDRFASNPIIHRMDFSFGLDGTIYGAVFARDSIYISKHDGDYWQEGERIDITTVWRRDQWRPLRRIKAPPNFEDAIIQADTTGIYLLSKGGIIYIPFRSEEPYVSVGKVSSVSRLNPQWVVNLDKKVIYFIGVAVEFDESINVGSFKIAPLKSHPHFRKIKRYILE